MFGQVRLGCVFKGRIVQKRAGSRMDVLLHGLIVIPALWRQSAFMSIRAADAASLIGKINSLSRARCMVR